MEEWLWLLAGLAAGLADYGLGIGFGLVASTILVTILGYDPRIAASSAATAQLVTTVPAITMHRRQGNIEPGNRETRAIVAVVAVSSTVTSLVSSAIAGKLTQQATLALYAAAMALMLPTALYGLRERGKQSKAGRPLLVAAITGSMGGFEKAITGGGFSVVVAAAQAAAGVDIKTAIALAPLAKMPALAVVALVYASHGYFLPWATMALSLGAVISIPVAARLLKRAGEKHLAKLMATVLATSAVIVIVRLAANTM